MYQVSFPQIEIKSLQINFEESIKEKCFAFAKLTLNIRLNNIDGYLDIPGFEIIKNKNNEFFAYLPHISRDRYTIYIRGWSKQDYNLLKEVQKTIVINFIDWAINKGLDLGEYRSPKDTEEEYKQYKRIFDSIN